MNRFQQLSLSSVGATFLLVTIGGLVRATKSGLGCGENWPDCPGQVTRALVIEMSHRAAAGIVVILLAALAITAVRHRATAPRLVTPSIAAFGLVLFQALLGAIVVWLRLRAESVILHLGTAMALLALVIYVAAASLAADGKLRVRGDAQVSRRAMGVAGAVLVLLLAGSYVTGRDAGYVFGDWPLMNGRLIPDLSIETHAINFIHRLLAAITGICLLVFGIGVLRRKAELPLQARLTLVALGSFGLEVLVGAATVWTRLDPSFVTLHLALGTIIWASVAGIAIVTRPGFMEAAGVARRAVPAFESA
jgi:cytochrome c oxidase assembly protein subunit 15